MSARLPFCVSCVACFESIRDRQKDRQKVHIWRIVCVCVYFRSFEPRLKSFFALSVCDFLCLSLSAGVEQAFH